MAKKILVKQKILVADDSEDSRELLKFTFELAGYEVTVVENGSELLEKIDVIKPDLIILDLVMPKMDGYTTLLELKKRPDMKDIPILVSSGKTKLKGLSVFQDKKIISDFVEKPYQPDEILKKVKDILEK